MDARRSVAVAGAGGVFGSLLVEELGRLERYEVVPLTRREADLRDAAAVGRAANGLFAFCCCAGPFQSLDRAVVREVIDAGAHWLDIADDPAWFFGLLDDADLDTSARARGCAVVSGLSTMPAISTALVREMFRESGREATSARITLWIGNRNAKGAGAIASALASRGELITPDRELLQRELGIEAHARVEFESLIATALMRILSRLPLGARGRLVVARLLSMIASPFSWFGSDYGELRVSAGGATVSLGGRGQRLAILPLVAVLDRLSSGALSTSGCMTPGEAIGDDDLIRFTFLNSERSEESTEPSR